MNAELEKRLNKLYYLLDKIEKNLTSSIYKEGDARYDILKYLLMEVNNFKIAEHAIFEYFYPKNKINEVELINEKINIQFNDFVNSYKDKFLIITYSYIEVFIRQIAYKKLNGNIKQVDYISIVIKKIDKEYSTKYHDLWDIFAKIRNSFHNLKHIKEDISIKYKDKEYNFKKDKYIEGFDFDNVLFIFEEIYDNIVMDLIDKNKEIEFVESVF